VEGTPRRRDALATALITYSCFKVQQRADIDVAHMADPTWRGLWATFTYLWFVQQLPCFLFGMLAFKWTVEGGTVRWPRTLVAGSFAAMVFLAFFHPPLHYLPYVSPLGLPMQYGFLFALLVLGLMHWSPRVLVNPVIGWIGKVSFSAYLIHFAVIATLPIPHANYAEAFISLTSITIAISSITYLCIEQPFNRLGGRVAERLRERFRETVGCASPGTSRSRRYYGPSGDVKWGEADPSYSVEAAKRGV
jgi:peptidoglycan/LPS O-acetylase OafA/YrhL